MTAPNMPVPAHNWKYLVGFLIGLIVAFVVIIVVANTTPVPPPQSAGFEKVPMETEGQLPVPTPAPALSGYTIS
jgi:hypothetical protein